MKLGTYRLTVVACVAVCLNIGMVWTVGMRGMLHGELHWVTHGATHDLIGLAIVASGMAVPLYLAGRIRLPLQRPTAGHQD